MVCHRLYDLHETSLLTVSEIMRLGTKGTGLPVIVSAYSKIIRVRYDDQIITIMCPGFSKVLCDTMLSRPCGCGTRDTIPYLTVEI